MTWHTSVALHKCAMTHFFDKTSLWIIHITVCQGKQKFDIIVFLCKNFFGKVFYPSLCSSLQGERCFCLRLCCDRYLVHNTIRTSPVLLVKWMASKYSSKGTAYLRVVLVKSLNCATLIGPFLAICALIISFILLSTVA